MSYPFRPNAEGNAATEIYWTPPRTQTRIRPPLRGGRKRKNAVRATPLEPIEPRFLLSADHLISIAALQDGLSGSSGDDSGIIDAISYLLENDENFDFFVPGVRFSAPPDSSLNPMVHELFALNVDANHDGELLDRAETINFANGISGVNISAPDDIAEIYEALGLVTELEFALSLMDLNDDGGVSFSEAADILITQPIVNFLNDFSSVKYDILLAMDIPTTYDDLIDGFVDTHGRSSTGFLNFLNALVEPTILNASVDLDFSDTVRVGTTGFNIDTDLSFTLSNEWLLDLGFAAEQLEIDTPTDSPLPGASISPQPHITIDATFEMDFAFGVSGGANSFTFAPEGDLGFTVAAFELLGGTTVNVGFLGMVADSSGIFELDLPYEAAFIDPSSPEHLGFRAGDFAADGDGEISDSTGLLSASDPLAGDEFNLLYDVKFSLQLGTQSGAGELPVVDLTIDEDDANGFTTAAEVVGLLQGKIDGSGLAGLISVGLDAGALTISVVDTDATDFGFISQNIFGGSGTLTATDTVLDFSADGSFVADILMSVDAGQMKLINFSINFTGADATARKNDFVAKANTAIDATFGANVVTVDVVAGDKIQFSTDGPDTLEITRTITMSADYGITAAEMGLAADENFARMFDVSIDPANDNFDISMKLDAKPHLTVVNGTLYDLNINITADLVTGTVDAPIFADGLIRVDDFAGFEKYDLGDQLTITADAGDVERFFNFTALGGAEVINVVSQLAGWLDRLPTTEMLGGYDLPFAESVIGENIDFATLIRELFIYDQNDPDDDFDDVERLLIKLNDPDAGDILIPSFATVQELSQRLVTLGLMSSTADAKYDVGEEELTYVVGADLTVGVIAPSVDFELDLDPLFDLSVEANVTILTEVHFDAILGFNLASSDVVSLSVTPVPDALTALDDLNAGDGVPIADYLAVTGAMDAARIEGRLSGDAHFAISVNGDAAVLVTIEANSTTDVTSDNTLTAHLVTDIQTAIDGTSLSGKVIVKEIGGRLVLEGLSVNTLSVFVTDTSIVGLTGFADTAYTELGFRDSAAATVTLVGEAITLPATGSSEFTIEINNDGTVETVSVTLDGANTVNDLVDRVNADLSGFFGGKIIAYRSGQSIGLAAIDASVGVFKIDAVDTDLGFSLNPEVAGIVLIGEDFVEADPDDLGLQFGRLDALASFSVDVGAANDTINISVSDTETNTSVSDLVDVINEKIILSALNGFIVAEQVGLGQIALRAISDTVTSIDITAGASDLGLFNSVVGAEAVPALRATASLFAPAYFGPSTDAHFTINFNDGSDHSVAVTVEADEARDNRFIYQLVNDVNRAIDDAFDTAGLTNPFDVTFDSQRLVIRGDGTLVSFDIDVLAGDASITDLKLHNIGTPAGAQTVTADQADLLIYTNNGQVHRISLDGDTTLADVQASIEASPDVLVGLNETNTGLMLTDTSGFGSNLFRVDSVNASRAVFSLGLHTADVQRILNNQLSSSGLTINELDGVIVGDEIGKLDFEDRLFLEQIDSSTPVLSADLFLLPDFNAVDGTAIVANFGFVGVELNGSGVLHLQLGLDLAKPQVTLANLFDAISTDLNKDGVRDVFDLAEFIAFPTLAVDPDNLDLDHITLDVSLPAGGGLPAGFGLGGTPEIVFTLLNAGDPFNTPAGALVPFDGAVDVDSNQITIAGHGFAEGGRVVYRAGVDGTEIGGLTDGDSYFVHVIDANTVQLAENQTEFDAENYLVLSDGAGANHRLQGFNPTVPDVDVTWSGLDDLAQFADVDFDDIINALRKLSDFLLEYAAQTILQEDIPVLGISFNELIGVAQKFANAVDDIVNNPPPNIQALQQKLLESFGLPEDASPISMELVDDNDGADGSTSDMLKLVLDFSRTISEPLDIDLALTDSGGVPFSVPVFGEISLVANADLGVTGTVDALFSVGIDLDDDGGSDELGEVFLFTHKDDTHLNLSLSAAAVNLFFNASLGPLGIAVIDGDANIQLGLDFFDDDAGSDTRVALADPTAAFSGFELAMNTGTFDLTFPVFFPTQSDFIGDIVFEATLGFNSPFEFNITTFDLPSAFSDLDFFTNFDLLSSIDLVVEALDLLLDTLQDVMSGELFGIELPILGDALKDGVDFVDDIRIGVIDPFFDLIENTPKTSEDLADLIQGYLFAILGDGVTPDVALAFPELDTLKASFSLLENGLGLLSDTNFSNIDNIIPLIFDPDGGGVIQWDFNFSRTFDPALNLDFDFELLPSIGLNFDGGIAAEFTFDFGFGVGISEADGAFINIDRRDGVGDPIPELSFSAIAGLTPDAALSGSLGFLAFKADTPMVDANGDGIEDSNFVSAEFEIDLVNGDDASDTRLSFFELGSLDFDVGFDTEAHLDLNLNLGFNADLLPPVVAGIMPNLEGDFIFNWDPVAVVDLLTNGFEFALESGRDLIAINNVALDLGSFLGDFLGPIVSQIQEYTEPLQPVIDIITAPIPGISDLAGRPISLVDLAAEFGEFDPGMIYAIADIVSFVNSTPATTDSIMLSLGDFTIFGSGILSAEQIMDPTFDFSAATQEGGDLFDTFSNMLSNDDIIGDAVQIFDAAGEFISGAFTGALEGADPSGTADSAAGVLGGDYNTGDYGFAFPFLEDPTQIFGALLGRPMVLITYDLAPFGVEFTWEQSFMIYGPLWGKIGVGVGVRADFAFGYDTLGIQRFAEGGFENPLDLVAGFYVSDTLNPDGSGPDVPELQLIGEFSLGAELNAGVASAGIEAAIIFTANFDLNDPDMDGRVRIDEILGNFLYELNYGDPILAPVAIFDISVELAFQIRAYLKILFAKFTFEIPPPITLFEFSIEFDREPILATERGDGGILLNMGPNAASRLHGNTNDIAESFFIERDGGDVLIWAPDLNVDHGSAQRYSGDFIVGFGGEFDDQLTVMSNVTLPVFFEGLILITPQALLV